MTRDIASTCGSRDMTATLAHLDVCPRSHAYICDLTRSFKIYMAAGRSDTIFDTAWAAATISTLSRLRQEIHASLKTIGNSDTVMYCAVLCNAVSTHARFEPSSRQ